MIRKLIQKTATSLLCSTVTTVLIAMVPVGQWQEIGRTAAMVAAGLGQPQESLKLIQTQAEQPPEAPPQSTTTTVAQVTLESVLQTPFTTVATRPSTPIPSGGGVVDTRRLSSGSSFVQGVAIKNNYGKAVDIAAALQHKPALSYNRKETAPQVLIVHTHTTECYLERDDGVYAPSDPTRTNDPSKNMVAVGKALAAQLNMAGIGVIHDTAIHDQPYTGAYGHSKAAIQQWLKQYPTIRVVLDLHRDAIYPDDNTRVKPTAVIDGKNAAQVMIIVGMLNTKASPNAHVQENLSFAVRLQQRLHTDYPGLMRPLNLANARYNQQLTNGSLLLEMGSDANTLEEALYAAELVGKGLVQVLNQL